MAFTPRSSPRPHIYLARFQPGISARRRPPCLSPLTRLAPSGPRLPQHKSRMLAAAVAASACEARGQGAARQSRTARSAQTQENALPASPARRPDSRGVTARLHSGGSGWRAEAAARNECGEWVLADAHDPLSAAATIGGSDSEDRGDGVGGGGWRGVRRRSVTRDRQVRRVAQGAGPAGSGAGCRWASRWFALLPAASNGVGAG